MRSISLLLISAPGLTAALLFWPHAGGGVPAAQPADVMLVVHGGAGVLTEKEMLAEGLKREQFEQALTRALSAGYEALQRKDTTSVDGVEAAIRVLEDSGLFNAGKGAALNHDGEAELDASIMEGRMTGKRGEGKQDSWKRAGAVGAVKHIKNPISAARAVMEDQRHVLLVGQGAEWFALEEGVRRKYHIEKVSNVSFWTDRRLKQIRQAVQDEGKKKDGKGATRREGGADQRFGTVGAVARKNGTLAAGTSTGGLTNKLQGRVGDSPLIGAGTYADDRACGVSCTGTGEVFIRHAVAHDVVARMLYKKQPIVQAVNDTIGELPDEEGGVGGLIALDKDGGCAFGMSAKSDGLYRGYVTEAGAVHVAIFAKEEFKRMATARK